MKKLFVAALILASFSMPALAVQKPRGMTAMEVKSLVSRIADKIETRKQKISRLDTKIVRFFLSPENPLQGQNIVVFSQISSRFLDTDTFLEGSFDGQPVSLEKSAAELWAYNAGSFSEFGDHAFTANVFIQDSAAAADLKAGIASLDAAIAALSDQIDEETNETVRNELIAQRAVKEGQRGELIHALNDLKKPIASETLTFSIGENPGAPGIPTIESVTPKAGSVGGGTFVVVRGLNFTGDMEVKIGGLAVSINFVSDTEFNFTTPDFGADGPKDLAIRIGGSNPKNALRKNAFYASYDLVENVRPVAVAGASQTISLGESANLNGAASYDENGNNLTYAWRLISAPEGSGLSIGDVYTTDLEFSYTPAKPGAYVWELVATEIGTTPALVSTPSLTVVTANPPVNSAPAPTADALGTVNVNGSAETQIAHNDADDYQAHTYLITKQSAFGTASVSSTGLVSFTATAAGSDSIEVAVVDNGTPPLSGTVSIPVEVVNSVVTVDSLYATVIARDGLIDVQLGADLINSSEGEIVSAVWDFGDGTSSPSLTPNNAFVRHDYVAAGTYTSTLTVTDSFGAVGTNSRTFTIGASSSPIVKVAANVVSGSVPLTVNFDTTGSIDDVGIVNYRWRWGDPTAQENTASNTISHTFNTVGTYRVRVRASDADANVTDGFVDIYAGTTPPATGSRPMSVLNVGSREVTLGQPHLFNGGNSFDPNPSGSIVDYRWRFTDFLTCDWQHPTPGCEASGATTSYTFPEAKEYTARLEVEGALGGIQSALKDIYVVNSGHAPRAFVQAEATQGVAPFTANFSGSYSFDYDGTIASYDWRFGDDECTSGCTASGVTSSYTYPIEDVYFTSLTVTDGDGNQHSSGREVIVYPSERVRKANEKKAKKRNEQDPEREYLRRRLVQSCFKGHAASCFEVGQMYQEDGNAFASGKYFEKACSMGYEAACSVRR